MNATIYQKTVVDKCAILDPGAFLLRKMNLNPNWTDLRIGAFVSFTTAGGDNETPVYESFDTAGIPLRLIAFGIKNVEDLSDPAAESLPGQAACQFVGVTNLNEVHTSAIMDTYSAGQGIQSVNYGYTDGTTIVCSVAGVTFGHLDTTADATADTLYSGFWGFRFERSGSDVTITRFTLENQTDVSASKLLELLSPVFPPPVEAKTFTLPFTVPDGFFLRMPFQNNRIRVHCYGWYDSTLY